MELEAAMMGNFGKSSAKSAMPVEDPKVLVADFAACGIVPAEKHAELQTRVDAASKIIFAAR